jgi:hypothetical protein
MKLANSARHLTLEFLIECCIGLSKIQGKTLRICCLNYMKPWLTNLNEIYSPGLEFSKPSLDPPQQKLKEVLRLLIDLTVNDPEVSIFVSCLDVSDYTGKCLDKPRTS